MVAGLSWQPTRALRAGGMGEGGELTNPISPGQHWRLKAHRRAAQAACYASTVVSTVPVSGSAAVVAMAAVEAEAGGSSRGLIAATFTSAGVPLPCNLAQQVTALGLPVI
eukprot:COSAG01_NODE_492_length_16335_cov_63.722284_8_plen_110_part_00